MSRRISKEQQVKDNHEAAYQGLLKTLVGYCCPHTGTVDMLAATDGVVRVRNEFIDRGSTNDYFRTILGQALNDVSGGTSGFALELEVGGPNDFYRPEDFDV